MARAYKETAFIETEPVSEDHLYERVVGITLSWVPGGGPFPLVLDRDREYRICFCPDRDTWILHQRTKMRANGGDDSDDDD